MRIEGKGGAAIALVLLALGAAQPAAAQWDSKRPAGFAARALDRGFIVGAWTDSEDCASAIAFDADGTFVLPDGAEGEWELIGDDLTMSGAGGETRLTIIPLDPDTMEVVDEEGGHGRSVRCAMDTEDEQEDPNFVARDVT